MGTVAPVGVAAFADPNISRGNLVSRLSDATVGSAVFVKMGLDGFAVRGVWVNALQSGGTWIERMVGGD